MKGLNKYILKLDTSEINVVNGTAIFGNLTLHLPVRQELDYKIVPYSAKVVSVTKHNLFNLKVGDTVIIDRFVNDNYIEGDLRFVNEKNLQNPTENMIYAIIKNEKAIMLNNNILVDKIENEVECSIPGFSIPESSKSKKEEAIVRFTHKNSIIPVGSKIMVINDNFWPIKIFGENSNMVDSKLSVPFYKTKNEEINLMPDWVLVSPDVSLEGFLKNNFGFYIPESKSEFSNRSEILKLPKNYSGYLKPGMSVIYKRQPLFELVEGNVRYYFANISERYDEIQAVLN